MLGEVFIKIKDVFQKLISGITVIFYATQACTQRKYGGRRVARIG